MDDSLRVLGDIETMFNGGLRIHTSVLVSMAGVVGVDVSNADIRDAIVQHEIQEKLAHHRIFVVQRSDPPYDVGYPERPCYAEIRDPLIDDSWIGEGESPVEALLDGYRKYISGKYWNSGMNSNTGHV